MIRASMVPARTVEDFTADPVGRFSAGATHVVWCHSPTLCGTVHWGRPTEADADGLIHRLEMTMHPALAAGFDGFMDARAMEAFDWSAFTVVSNYVKSRLSEWSRRMHRHAVVVPPGVVGALVAGLLPLLGPDYPLRFFSSVAEAATWIDRSELETVVDEVNRLADQLRQVAPLVRALREHLDGLLAEATLDRAARALGLSSRSLQRELRKHGTQFVSELVHARTRAACLLLEHSDEKIEAIARRVGCASSSQLSAMFRNHVGETPVQYRARRRSSQNR